MSARARLALLSRGLAAHLQGVRTPLAPALLRRCRFAAEGARLSSSSSPPPRATDAAYRQNQQPRQQPRQQAHLQQQQPQQQQQQQQQPQQQQQQQQPNARQNEGDVSELYADVALSRLGPLLQRTGIADGAEAVGDVPRFGSPPPQSTAADVASLLFGDPYIMKGPVRPDRLEVAALSPTRDHGDSLITRPLALHYRELYFSAHDAEGAARTLSQAEIDAHVDLFFGNAVKALQGPLTTRPLNTRACFSAKTRSSRQRLEGAVVGVPSSLPRIRHDAPGRPVAAGPLLTRAGTKSSVVKWRKRMAKKVKWKRQRKEKLRKRILSGDFKRRTE